MKLITANRLSDGQVIFLTSNGWSRSISEAFRFTDETGRETAMDRANDDVAANEIVDPYEIDIELEGESAVPVRLRERIRALGPTTGNSLAFTEEFDTRPARVA